MPGPVYNQKGGSIEVDHAFDANSENPVANSFLTDVLGGGANYVQPTASLNIGNVKVEKGTLVQGLDLAINFSKNDAGNATAYRIYKDNVLLASAQSVEDIADFTVLNDDVEFKGEVDHEAGVIKNNDLGIPDAAGQIPAGTKETATRTYTPDLYIFFGAVASVPNTSAAVRALPQQTWDNANGVNINTGTTHKNFVVAVEQSKTNAASISAQDSTNNVTLTFAFVGTVAVALPNGNGTETYRIYAKTVDNPYPSNAVIDFNF